MNDKLGTVSATSARTPSHRWQNWLVAAVALWLLCSPELIAAISSTSHAGGRNDLAIWNVWLVGILGLIFAAMGLVASRPWPSFLMLVLAGWLALSPWALGYEHLSFWTWNALLAGGAIGISEASVLLDRFGLLPSLVSDAQVAGAPRQSGRPFQVHRLAERLSALLKSIRSASAGADRLRPGR